MVAPAAGSGGNVDSIELAARIRRHALRMTSLGGSSHVGSVFSMADIVAVLYGGVLAVDPQNPRWPDRDRLILSKGHAGAGIYAALAERGFFPVERLDSHCADGSILSGHVSHKGVPGVELSTGALGHGLAVAAGIAFAGKRRRASWRTFVIQSDGECDEGSVWEAALFAGHHRLDRLVTVIDYNKIQSLASTTDTLDLEPFADKWRSFGWSVAEADGHDHAALRKTFDAAAGQGRPACVIAHTVKGRGVSFMENSVLWHYRTARGAEYEAAARELGAVS
jgi:transketolase